MLMTAEVEEGGRAWMTLCATVCIWQSLLSIHTFDQWIWTPLEHHLGLNFGLGRGSPRGARPSYLGLQVHGPHSH